MLILFNLFIRTSLPIALAMNIIYLDILSPKHLQYLSTFYWVYELYLWIILIPTILFTMLFFYVSKRPSHEFKITNRTKAKSLLKKQNVGFTALNTFLTLITIYSSIFILFIIGDTSFGTILLLDTILSMLLNRYSKLLKTKIRDVYEKEKNTA